MIGTFVRFARIASLLWLGTVGVAARSGGGENFTGKLGETEEKPSGINNAVDAMEEVNGGTLTVRTLCEGENVVVLFSDPGRGVKEPRLVFDSFYTTKPVGKGTGLGLSICYEIIHDHRGHISCYNRPEGGATFRIEVPAVPGMLPSRAIDSPHSATTATPT